MKAHVLFYMLYRLHFMAAVTEYGGVGCEGIADLYGITDADLTHEIEVKVSRADLMGELVAIRYHVEEKLADALVHPSGMPLFGIKPDAEKAQKPAPPQARKGTKHWWYLRNEGNVQKSEWGNEYWRQKPNRFSFAVPPALAAIAKEYLKGTPYGLIVVTAAYDVSTVKKAEYLHKEKVSDKVLRKILHKTSTEIQSVRSELVTAHANYTAVLARLPKE